MAPFAKTGGLADVMGGAARAISIAPATTCASCLPLYDTVDTSKATFEWRSATSSVRLGSHRYTREIFRRRRRARRSTSSTARRSTAAAGSTRATPTSTAASSRCRCAALDALPADGLRARHHPRATTGRPRCCRCSLKTLFAWDRLFARTRTLLTIHNLMLPGQLPRRGRAATRTSAPSAHLFHQDLLQRGPHELPAPRASSTPTASAR